MYKNGATFWFTLYVSILQSTEINYCRGILRSVSPLAVYRIDTGVATVEMQSLV